MALALLLSAACGLNFPASNAQPPDFWRGKRVLLAGASSGLGEALAIELSSRGASLVLAARRADRLATIAEQCGDAHVLPMDVCADAATLEAGAAEAAALLGGSVDCLCYAAGVGQRTLATETAAEGHRQLMATNFEGAVALTRAVLPPMLAAGGGQLVVVSSVQGFFGQPARSSYAASKAAMISYFDAVRAEVAPRGVGVTVVAPGYIATDHSANAVGGDGAADENSSKGMAPDELARMIAAAVEGGKPQLIASQLDGKLAIVLRSLWPEALYWLMERKARKLLRGAG